MKVDFRAIAILIFLLLTCQSVLAANTDRIDRIDMKVTERIGLQFT
jgi:hypothetical protein